MLTGDFAVVSASCIGMATLNKSSIVRLKGDFAVALSAHLLIAE